MRALDPLHQLDDDALIHLASQGGEEARAAYGVLILRHQEWLVRVTLFLLRDAFAADDVAQEVLVKAYAALPEYRGGAAAFRGWLRRIATNLSYNWSRDARTRRRHQDAAETSRYAPSHGEEVEQRELLLQTLDHMPYPYREVLLLRYIEELSIEEVARHLDLGLSAAKMRLQRARKAFRQQFDDEASP